MTEEMTDPEFIRRRRRGRLMLVGVAVVFIGPLIAAFLLYFGGNWSPQGSAEHGALILPPRLMPDSPLSGGREPAIRLRDKWTLLIVEPAACDESCRTVLYETRQLRRALGKDMDRVQRVWVLTDGHADAGFVSAEHPDLVVVDSDDPAEQALLEIIGPHTAGEAFLIDPHGNLMMRFPPGLSMRAIHTDLKRLLKVSQIG
ncbi:MAG TPA: cytochrome oxidase assembly protein [Chromatiales bacterium]|nr:cytochrome oxidase assembly protein [Chromatiales bacterium]